MREGRTKTCDARVDLVVISCWELFMCSANAKISASVQSKMQ